MDIHIDIPKEWVQWFLLMVGVSLAKAIVSTVFEIEPYPMERPGTYIREHEWAHLLYWLVDDLGDAASFVFLLRAVGLVVFK